MDGNQALAKTSKPRSQPCGKAALIRLWIGKLALNAGQALDSTDVGVYESLWLEGLEDLPYEVLERAFQRTLQDCKYWPVKVADIRERIEHTKQIAFITEAALKWTRVLDYIRLYFNPDMPGGASSGAPKITERTMTAIRAAGGLAWIADCTPEQLVWARKTFCESYVNWAILERDQYLLPDGEVKNAIASMAQMKSLPE